MDRLYGEGVRYIFPIHLVDNPIGGAAVYEPMFDYANEWEEGYPYALGCSQPADNIGYSLDPTLPSELKIAEEVKLGRVLSTPPTLACPSGTGNVNTRGLSQAGIAAIQEMMSKHMLIDIDHMSQLAANGTIDLARQHKPYPYPLFSGHNGVRSVGGKERSLTDQQYQAIGQLHGMAGVGSAKLTAPQWLSNYNQVIQAMGPGAVAGFGTDTDGLEFGMPPNTIFPVPSTGCPSGYQQIAVSPPLALTACISTVQYDQTFPMSTEGNRTWDRDYFCRVFSLSSARFNSSSFFPASASLPSAVRRW